MGINEYIKIGTKLKEVRQDANISQKDMALKLNISVSTYSNYENEYREPPLEILKSACDIIGITLDELILQKKLSDIFKTIHPNSTDKEIIEEYILLNQSANDIVELFVNNNLTEDELKEIKNHSNFIINKRAQEKPKLSKLNKRDKADK